MPQNKAAKMWLHQLQKCVSGPWKKSTWCNQGTAAAFKNLGWQNNAWMQPNLQAGNTYTTDGTFYRRGSIVETSHW